MLRTSSELLQSVSARAVPKPRAETTAFDADDRTAAERVRRQDSGPVMTGQASSRERAEIPRCFDIVPEGILFELQQG